jgi:hypothetical protein
MALSRNSSALSCSPCLRSSATIRTSWYCISYPSSSTVSIARPTPGARAALPAPSFSDRPERRLAVVGVVPGKAVGHGTASSRSGLHRGRRSCLHLLMQPASSHPSHPASVGLACRPVGTWRRHLVKRLDSTGTARARTHFRRRWTLAAVRASGAVYAVDHGLSDSPCQIRLCRIRIARTMDKSAGPTRLRKGAGDESEGGRLPGGQGHDYRTA